MPIVDHRSVQTNGQAAARGVGRPVPSPADEGGEASAASAVNEAFGAFEASAACGERDAPGFPRRSLAGRQPRGLQAQGAGRLSYRELHRQHYRPRSNRVPRWLQQVWAWL